MVSAEKSGPHGNVYPNIRLGEIIAQYGIKSLGTSKRERAEAIISWWKKYVEEIQ